MSIKHICYLLAGWLVVFGCLNAFSVLNLSWVFVFAPLWLLPSAAIIFASVVTIVVGKKLLQFVKAVKDLNPKDLEKLIEELELGEKGYEHRN